MLHIDIVCVGTLRESWLREAAAEYEKRLGAYCVLKNVEVSDDEGLRRALTALPAKTYKIALCIEGKMLSSEMLADRITSLTTGGYSSIAFVIGGTDGIPEDCKAMCAFRLSFSPMTFPHPLMRVILLEQIYRACNLAAGGKYHH